MYEHYSYSSPFSQHPMSVQHQEPLLSVHVHIGDLPYSFPALTTLAPNASSLPDKLDCGRSQVFGFAWLGNFSFPHFLVTTKLNCFSITQCSVSNSIVLIAESINSQLWELCFCSHSHTYHSAGDTRPCYSIITSHHLPSWKRMSNNQGTVVYCITCFIPQRTTYRWWSIRSCHLVTL